MVSSKSLSQHLGNHLMTAYRTQSRKPRNAKSANGFRSIPIVNEFMPTLCGGNQKSKG